MKLSIVVVTMNRAYQLAEALQSCVDCNIPEDTEFVIIDNASNDDTPIVINNFFLNNSYTYYYERLDENIGCGNGRNYAYSKSHGDYIYVLDDDAYIDTSQNPNFFKKAIEILDNNIQIKTLTTQIYDLVWKKNRVDLIGPQIDDGLFKVYMFCGGSHFLKRDFFKDTKPYYANNYGYEEIFPSLSVYDAGYINAFAADLLIIHNPHVNKWDENSEIGIHIAALGLAQTFMMRSALFPLLIKPLNFLAFIMRLLLRQSLPLIKETMAIIMNTTKDKNGNVTLKYSTIFRLFQDFKFSIF